jgi:hypothetical protein|uniref:Uncharacterized protein n=1 Tax=Eutreptiella gymnastica TaxID=73025 RepID=A0A7S4LIT6_9EUGL
MVHQDQQYWYAWQSEHVVHHGTQCSEGRKQCFAFVTGPPANWILRSTLETLKNSALLQLSAGTQSRPAETFAASASESNLGHLIQARHVPLLQSSKICTMSWIECQHHPAWCQQL